MPVWLGFSQNELCFSSRHMFPLARRPIGRLYNSIVFWDIAARVWRIWPHGLNSLRLHFLRHRRWCYLGRLVVQLAFWNSTLLTVDREQGRQLARCSEVIQVLHSFRIVVNYALSKGATFFLLHNLILIKTMQVHRARVWRSGLFRYTWWQLLGVL